MTLISFDTLEPGSCPPSHPHTYDKGTKCCKSDECSTEKAFYYEGDCCKDDDYVVCEFGVCKDRLNSK